MFDDFDTQIQSDELIPEGYEEWENIRRIKMAPKIGDKIRIISMNGEPRYAGKEGIIHTIDSLGQLHGSWGGLAVIPGEDSFEIIEEEE